MRGFCDDRKSLMNQSNPRRLVDDIKEKSLSEVRFNFSPFSFITTIENNFILILIHFIRFEQFDKKGRFGGREQIAQFRLNLQTDIETVFNDFVS